MSILESSGRPRACPTRGASPGTTCDRQLAVPSQDSGDPAGNTIRAVAHRRDGRMIALADDANRHVPAGSRHRETERVAGQAQAHALLAPCLLTRRPHPRVTFKRPHRKDRAMTEVRLWDLASGALVAGMPESFVHCHQIVFSPDGGTLVTVEAVGRNPNAPVRVLEAFGRSETHLSRRILAAAIKLKARLSRRHPRGRLGASGRSSSPTFSNVTPQDGSNLAVWLEDGRIDIRDTRSAFCKAFCRVVGTEVVFIPRTDQPVPYTQAEVDEIGRVACALTGCARARPISHDVAVWWAQFSPDGRTAAVQMRNA